MKKKKYRVQIDKAVNFNGIETICLTNVKTTSLEGFLKEILKLSEEKNWKLETVNLHYIRENQNENKDEILFVNIDDYF